MSNLEIIPLEDGFRTSLSQQWAGWTGTINVASTPNFTFPSGVTTYIVANPWKSNMQIAEINAYDGSAKTLTVNDITLEKWASVNSTAQTHAVWSEIIISDNYAFWKDIRTAINSKMNLDEDNVVTAGKTTFTSTIEVQLNLQNVTTTERDALTWVANWDIVYNETTWVLNQYISWAWTTFASWTTVNASTTVAGKIELATVTEQWTATSTGWSWAKLVMANGNLVKTSAWAWDENKVWVLGATWLYDSLVSAASISTPWLAEMLTDAEATAWTDETRYINSKQVKDNFWLAWVVSTTLTFDEAWDTLALAHWLSKIPRKLRFDACQWDNFGVYWVDWGSTEQKCSYSSSSAGWARIGIKNWYIAYYDQADAGTDYARRAVTTIDATNVNLTRTGDWSLSTSDVDYIMTAEI